MDDVKDMNIRDESVGDEKKFQFYIGSCPRGSVTRDIKGKVKFRWTPVGAFNLKEARVWIQGLLELLVIAEQLELELEHGEKKKARRR